MKIIRKMRLAMRTRGPRGKLAAGFAVAAIFVLARCSDTPVAPVSESLSPAGPQGTHVGTPSSAFEDFEFIHPFLLDDGGPNDVPAQSDLNAFTRADNVSGWIGVQWLWDNVAQWTGSGQTGDACALFDTDPSNANKGVGMADYAVCVRITNPGGDGSTTVQLSPGSPLLYSCGDTKVDRCASKTALQTPTGIHCEVERITGENFFALGEDGADILATCKIPLATFGTNVTPNLINVCSFPSGSPNSNPFDCVIRAGAGLLRIVKETTPQNSGQTFSFAVSPAPFTAGPYNITDNGGSNESITLSVEPATYSVTETVPSTWELDAASCVRETTPDETPTGTKVNNAVTGIVVTGGETTVCTFKNKVVAPSMSVQKTANPTSIPETGGDVTYTVVVTNNSVIPITLNSLIDDTFGDLDGVGTCNSAADPTNPYGSIAANGDTYTCTFTKTLGASDAGLTHVNEVTAYASSDGGDVEDSDDATVTYTDVLPDISVTKSADITSIPANGGTSVEGFSPDATFARNGNGGGGGNGGLNFASSICDDGGPNDINAAQSDLNCFARADNIGGRLGVRWTWDSTDEWGGIGQTGDACALLDTDGDGDANYAFCVRITNPSLSPLTIDQAEGSPILYECKDVGKGGLPDRCASPTSVKPLDASSVCTVSIVDEHFDEPGNEGDDGADVQAECNLRLQDLHLQATNANVDLVNVCSFPSGSPNSNPFDCVVTPGAGFLVIAKTTTPANSDSYFGFRLRNAANTANALSTNNQDEWAVQGGATSVAIPILPGTYALTELLPTNWSLTSISCVKDGVGVGNTSGNTMLNVAIAQGQTTTCIFSNSLVASQLVTFTVEVTNNSLEDVTLFSLEDTENPDAGTPTYSTLNGVGDCATGGSIAGGGTYSCTFTRTISGSPGFEHKDKVRAVGNDDDNNSTDPALSNVVTVTIIE